MTFLVRLSAMVGPLAWLVCSAGCTRVPVLEPPGQSPVANGVSLAQLGQALKLKVVQQTAHHATLNGGQDCVTIFADPDGAVYVNARRLGDQGPVVVRDGTLYVSEALIGRIRPLLRGPSNPPPPGPLIVEQQPPLRPPTRTAPLGLVVLDPGHGGKDSGAVGVNGIMEKDLVLKVARLVRQKLTEQNVKVLMTRDADEFIELEARPAVATQAQADLFVSIHADSAPNRAAAGHTLYVPPVPSAASSALAGAVSRRLEQVNDGHGIRPRELRVLVHSTCPAVLIELGYLSNRAEAARLATDSFCQALAAAIADGLTDTLRKEISAKP